MLSVYLPHLHVISYHLESSPGLQTLSKLQDKPYKTLLLPERRASTLDGNLALIHHHNLSWTEPWSKPGDGSAQFATATRLET